MNKQDKKQTKWGWGLVALAGLLAATTIDGSLVITAASVAIFGIGAYLGGYIDTEDAGSETASHANNQQERRAA